MIDTFTDTITESLQRLACFCSKNFSSFGPMVLIPGIENNQFGYYVAAEKQFPDHWEYYIYSFTPRSTVNTYTTLLEYVNKQTFH